MMYKSLRKAVRNLLYPPKPWQRVPTMLHPNELRGLHDLALHMTGEGQIVDLGTWLGGSTAALAAGLSENERKQAPGIKVHAYDLFLVDEFSKNNKHIPQIQSRAIGESFLPSFMEHVHRWKDRVEAHPGDLTQQTWDKGPIEILHVDIMKNWELANKVVSGFFPHLIPGRSMVVHQDFAHYYTGWIHVLMYRLRDHFEPVRHVLHTPSFVFRHTRSIPPALLDQQLGPNSMNQAEMDAAFAWSRNLLPADAIQRFSIDAAQAMMRYHLGDQEGCATLLQSALRAEEKFRQAHPAVVGRSELKLVKQWVDKKTA